MTVTCNIAPVFNLFRLHIFPHWRDILTLRVKQLCEWQSWWNLVSSKTCDRGLSSALRIVEHRWGRSSCLPWCGARTAEWGFAETVYSGSAAWGILFIEGFWTPGNARPCWMGAHQTYRRSDLLRTQKLTGFSGHLTRCHWQKPVTAEHVYFTRCKCSTRTLSQFPGGAQSHDIFWYFLYIKRSPTSTFLHQAQPWCSGWSASHAVHSASSGSPNYFLCHFYFADRWAWTDQWLQNSQGIIEREARREHTEIRKSLFFACEPN